MWEKVRAFGELQILTRASYFVLLFVPILAGVWPVVRAVFNRYNEAVTESKEALIIASEKLELTVRATPEGAYQGFASLFDFLSGYPEKEFKFICTVKQ